MSKRSNKSNKESNSLINSAAAYVQKRFPPNTGKRKAWKPAKVAPLNRYKQIPISKTTFAPVVHPVIFSQMSAWFLQESPNETAGYFNWDEESNMIDWCWHDEEAVKTSGHVVYGTAKMRMAWPEAGIPTGQWHTHPGIGTFWSATDETGQLEFLDALRVINPDGYFCFIVIDGLDWHCTKVVWKDGEPLERQNGKALVNGVPLSGRTKNNTYTYRGANTVYGASNKKDDWWSGAYGGYDYYDQAGNTFVPKKIEEPIVKEPILVKDLKEIEHHPIDYKPDEIKGELDDEFAELFDIFLVDHYDWPELYISITTYYPDDYNEIVSGHISWDWIRTNLLKKVEADMPLLYLADTDEELLGLSALERIDNLKGKKL